MSDGPDFNDGLGRRYLSDAAAKTHAFEDLMKGQSSHERSDGALILRHSHSDADDHGVEYNPNLQHLRHQTLLELGKILRRRRVVAVQRARLHSLQLRELLLPLLRTKGLVGVGPALPRAVNCVLDVGAGGEVDKEGEEGAEQGNEPSEGEVPPGVAGGDGAVGEGIEGVGEDVNEGGGEDDAGGEALDEEDGAVVGGLAVEEAGEEDGGGDAGDASKEDDEDGDELEVGSRSAVSASEFSSPIRHAPTHLSVSLCLSIKMETTVNNLSLSLFGNLRSSPSSSSLSLGPASSRLREPRRYRIFACAFII